MAALIFAPNLLLIVVVVKFIRKKMSSVSKEGELEQKLEIQNNELQALQEKLSAAQENKKIDVSIEELEDFILTGNSSARSAEELYEKYSALEKPKEKTGYDVWWVEGFENSTDFSDDSSVVYSLGIYNDIFKYGGYFVHLRFSSPQLVLAKSTKTQSALLLKFDDGYSRKFLREISDDRMYTLLLFYLGDNVAMFLDMIKELTEKSADQGEMNSSSEELTGELVNKWRQNAPRLKNDDNKYGVSGDGNRVPLVVARSKDKEKLLDYAEQFAIMDVCVKVI